MSNGKIEASKAEFKEIFSEKFWFGHSNIKGLMYGKATIY